MTADQPVTVAREYLAGARQRDINHLPPSRLMSELAETRRQLGQVLAAVGDQAPPLTGAQLATVLDALEVAADYRRGRAATCPDCDAHPAELCGACEYRLATADGYDALPRLCEASSGAHGACPPTMTPVCEKVFDVKASARPRPGPHQGAGRGGDAARRYRLPAGRDVPGGFRWSSGRDERSVPAEACSASRQPARLGSGDQRQHTIGPFPVGADI